ncbi:hypothetical protein QBC34DRAFT_479767 [Podospora aff. communis PSN243]|uniref:Uncharacterized protein n=1 Tax=Podospora aff. communis PSN243 TaxID=3040156 RepID=A0AAV9G364_9PEZI|nr:hypothetical protein QBC34DRAFT_479767 [Podospora aff. communis PSN243]
MSTTSATPSAEPPSSTTTTDNTNSNSSSAGAPRPKRPKARALTREEVIEVRALKKYARWTYEQIVAATGFTINQVQVACKGTPRYPKKVDRWTVNAGGVGVGVGGGWMKLEMTEAAEAILIGFEITLFEVHQPRPAMLELRRHKRQEIPKDEVAYDHPQQRVGDFGLGGDVSVARVFYVVTV